MTGQKKLRELTKVARGGILCSVIIPRDPKAACELLRNMARSEPDVRSFNIVREALRHPREGIQICAVQLLGAWRGRDAVNLLREWLIAALHRRHGWAGVRQGALSLSRCVLREDAPWVLDLYFGKTTRNQKHLLLPLVLALPIDYLAARIVQEADSPSPLNREAVIPLLRVSTIPNRDDLIKSWRAITSPRFAFSQVLLTTAARKSLANLRLHLTRRRFAEPAARRF